MKVSKIFRPNLIKKFVNEQNSLLSEIFSDLKIFNLKYSIQKLKRLQSKKLFMNKVQSTFVKSLKDTNITQKYNQIYKTQRLLNLRLKQLKDDSKEIENIKNLKRIIRNLKDEKIKLRKVLNTIMKDSFNQNIKFFSSYRNSLNAGIIRRQLSICHKHLQMIIKYNERNFLDKNTINSLERNYKRFLIINLKAKSLTV